MSSTPTAPCSRARREPLQPRGDRGQGGAAGPHRARGRGRLSRQVLEHRRRRTAARRRHGRSLRRRPRGLARLVAGPGDDPGRRACRGRDGCVAGGAAGTPQGGRGGRHADAQFRHLLRHDGAARRPLEGSAQRLSGLARHPHGSGVPGAGERHPAASRRAARGSRRDRDLAADHRGPRLAFRSAPSAPTRAPPPMAACRSAG